MGFLFLGFGFVLFLIALAIACFVFWLIMLIHVLTHEVKDKLIWTLVMIFTGLIGAIIYYYVVKRNFAKIPEHKSSETPSHSHTSQ